MPKIFLQTYKEHLTNIAKKHLKFTKSLLLEAFFLPKNPKKGIGTLLVVLSYKTTCEEPKTDTEKHAYTFWCSCFYMAHLWF